MPRLKRRVLEQIRASPRRRLEKMQRAAAGRVAESAHIRSRAMKMTRLLWSAATAAGFALALNAAPLHGTAVQQPSAAVTIDADDLGGVVAGANGPEAGVWAIAETRDLPTKFVKIVVTDDQGRYLIPDLPKANYDVWVRGYGLVDSDKVKSDLGRTLNLKAKPAPDEAAAAHYYPSLYWYAMMQIPDKSEFGGKSEIPEKLTQVDWLKQMKNIGCIGCHQ